MARPGQEDGRRVRSRRTRARVVEAARSLFIARGYVATTIEAVADEAGVAVQTVYYVFTTKPNLLAAVLDASIAGDGEPVAIVEQPWVELLAAEEDAASAIHHLLAGATIIVARAAPVYEVVRRAAADPEVAALLAANRAGRRADQRRLIEMLSRAGHLRAGLDLDTAADVFYALINEEVFQFLTVDCGWAVERFQEWAAALMLEQLADGRDPGS